MKRKLVLRLLSLSLAAAVTGTMFPSSVYFVNAAENSAAVQIRAGQEDGINDAWAQDPASVAGTGAVCAVEDGWLHLKSDPSNGNNPGTKPAIFVNPGTFDFGQEGYFDFTLKSNNGNTGQNDSDRFGVYLGYDTDGNGMFVGYDNGGWFWQKYSGGNGDLYQGSRHAAPAQGEEAAVHIEWTADHKMTLTLDGETVFADEDFSGIAGTLGSKIAFKCGSWSQNVTDVLIKDIHYTGQAEAVVYQVSGKVTDAQGNPIELAGGVNTDGAIDVVRENFENALQNAQDILAKVQSGDTSVTQSQVDNAWRNLIKAMQYMEFKEANKDDLAKVIALAEEMSGNLDKYLEDGKEAFTSALAEAKEVYEDPIATQEEVNNAWKNLLNAMANMMLKPDKGLLEDLIAQAEGLNEADYEAQSFAAMRTALVAAKEVLADENATEEEISTSVAALEDALAKLTPVSTSDDQQGGNTGSDQSGTGNSSQDKTSGAADKNNTSSAGGTSASKTSGTKAVKTGDTAGVLPFAAAAAMAAAAAGAAVLLKKKEEN